MRLGICQNSNGHRVRLEVGIDLVESRSSCKMNNGRVARPVTAKMTFYGQLDSINDDICIADCGMIYVFICFDCFKAISIVQSN